jgi:hypothetical protein
MGLDGYVACDCVEKGVANVSPAIASLVKSDRDIGSNYFDSLDKRHRQVYSQWCSSKPCPHDGFILMSQRLEGAAGIAEIRKVLAERVQDPKKGLRLLWTKVMESGVHSGDSLRVEQVARLQAELQGGTSAGRG